MVFDLLDQGDYYGCELFVDEHYNGLVVVCDDFLPPNHLVSDNNLIATKLSR